jgi:hypothetical protein
MVVAWFGGHLVFPKQIRPPILNVGCFILCTRIRKVVKMTLMSFIYTTLVNIKGWKKKSKIWIEVLSWEGKTNITAFRVLFSRVISKEFIENALTQVLGSYGWFGSFWTWKSMIGLRPEYVIWKFVDLDENAWQVQGLLMEFTFHFIRLCSIVSISIIGFVFYN